jgi:ABC-type nickel/cobalt efflux system permease component RcnA
MGRRLRRCLRRTAIATAAVVLVLLVPAAAFAHPLGNFTINHYAGITVAPDRIDLDVIIDMAEIPAFQERQDMDTDGDGSVSDPEGAAWAAGACAKLAGELSLARDSSGLGLAAGASSVTFPPGAGGLSTLRLECGYESTLDRPIASRTEITFSDRSYHDRLGWHEIVPSGAGTIVDPHGLPTTSPTNKLTSYPTDLVKTPLDVREATITAMPGGPGPSGGAVAGQAAGTAGSPEPLGAVPGGVAADVPEIFRTADLTPLVVLASLLTAVAIGAGHALTPGHGKTLMAAYLVGSRGTPVHAVGLGMSVAVSHTLGILALALVIVGAGSILPPDLVYRVTPVIAGASIVAIGGWMLGNEVRRRARRAQVAPVVAAHHVHELAAGGGHREALGHDHGHPHDDEDGREHDRHEHALEGDRRGPGPAPADRHSHDHVAAPAAPGEHTHGGVTHSHVPAAGSTLTWRGLFVLGLAGGLIPSTSALIILLGSIAAGRPAFGLILVVAFGLGMAAVMTGVGLAMIVARTRLDRMPSSSSLGRLAVAAPLVASIAVLGLGLVLTWQALAGTPVL